VGCAIYTRKSTDEGLELEFNSLDAQRECAEAYILSQRHEGWTVLPHRYDDGGFTGANTDRPGLRQLLADVEAGRIDCVVVYKVDRLSRSLLDFARIMEVLDQRRVSFVSVTQQLNSSSPMGRLTLNVLLSFAQFEREIISERTRDKMSAARRKGKWVGGTPVLGYDVAPGGGRLVINEREAVRVREIFELYRSSRSLSAVVTELSRRRWRTKSWRSKPSIEHSGRPFTKASLGRFLTHAVYAGKVEHRGALYTGEHASIVESVVWEEVNAELRAGQRSRADVARTKQNALLAGLLMCQSCKRPMIATYTAKRARRYRYYVCQAARQNGWESCPTKSVAAALIEESVVAQLRIALSTDHTRDRLDLSETDWQAFLQGNHTEVVHAVVEQIGYDGTTGGVQLKLRMIENQE
jgi:site-specific DNA recombinase